MSVIYKIFFEVQLLHEYYLQNSKGDTYFTLPDDQQRNAFLLDKLQQDAYQLSHDWDIQPLPGTALLLKNYRMRLLSTPTGFRVAISVKQQRQGTTVSYLPFVVPDVNTPLEFAVVPRYAGALAFTNCRMRRSTPAIYYFTNRDTAAKTFPSLSVPVPAQDNTRRYEQGELALAGGKVKEYVNRSGVAANDPSQWREVKGSGLAHEGDRPLLPFAFTYTFPPEAQVKQGTATVTAVIGGLQLQQSWTSASVLRTIPLDFSGPLADQSLLADGWYNLLVTGDNSYNAQQTVYLSRNGLYQPNSVGIISITPGNTGTAPGSFDLLESDGSLKTKWQNGVRLPHTVYEVRFRSRSAYWRYQPQAGQTLSFGAHADTFLSPADPDGRRTSLDPWPFSYSKLFFPVTENNTTTYEQLLPNPAGFALSSDADQRLYADVVILLSKIFPQGP